MVEEIDSMAANSKLLEVALAKEIVERNTLKISEFSVFRPLFLIGGGGLGRDEYRELALQWRQRVSLYHKVNIVEDYEINGKAELLFTLPPMFVAVDAINKATDHANQVVSMFDNAMTRDSPLRTDLEKALSIMENVFYRAQDKNRIAGTVKEYATLMNRLHEQIAVNADGMPSSGDKSHVDTTVITDWQ